MRIESLSAWVTTITIVLVLVLSSQECLGTRREIGRKEGIQMKRKLVKVKKCVIMSGMALLLAGAIAQPAQMTVYAAQTQITQQHLNQSPRWEGQGDTWRVRTADNKGYLKNTWFEDLDKSWYLLGADGYMYSGLITDSSTGKTYLLNTNHDGTFGRMLSTNGVYQINGKQVYLEFNQSHDGTFGAITSGLSEVKRAGLSDVSLNHIPVDVTEDNTAQIAEDRAPAPKVEAPAGNTGNTTGRTWATGKAGQVEGATYGWINQKTYH